MKKRKAISIYAIFVGLLMFMMWSFFLIAGMVPELETKPAEIILHLVAEFSTAFLLIIAGISALKKSRHSKWLYPFSIGMLMYTLIVSPGYYLQAGEYFFVAMFSVLIVLSIVFLTLFLRGNNEG